MDETKKTLGDLVSTINKARSEFKELSFISLPKMKLISEKVVTRNYDLAGCIDDIGMHLTLTLDTKVKGNLEKNIAVRSLIVYIIHCSLLSSLFFCSCSSQTTNTTLNLAMPT